MKKIVTLVLVLGSFSIFGSDLPDHPMTPDATLTPGALCTSPTEYRYAEHIAYCERNVSSATKADVFRIYKKRGFTLSEPRDHYKIDHFVPLCAGGSNDIKNLWPQHESIFTVTDDLEAVGCERMKLGKIKQKDFLALLKKAKYDNSKAKEVLDYLFSL